MVISLGEARAAGLTRQQLRGKQWTRLGYGLYAPSGEPADRGTKGIARLQAVADLADGRAESAMESRLRLLLMDAGLPRPESQVAIFDPDGHFVARVDLYFRNARLAVEYDGATHRDSLLADNRRQNELLGVGVALLRYCADDVYNRKHTIAGQVRDRFASAGIRLDFGKQRQPKPG